MERKIGHEHLEDMHVIDNTKNFKNDVKSNVRNKLAKANS